jgi:probable rRNA maturation factor
MILLDPDLDSDPAPKTTSAKLKAVPGSPKRTRNLRLPSARALARFLAIAQTAVRLRGQVTVLLTTDAAIHRLNRRFRGKNLATDVLSFPAEAAMSGPEKIAGDLAISVPTALRQAVEQGHSLSTEVKVLILHGLLHLAGYDHEEDDGRMARRELVLRSRLGLPRGLIERVAAQTRGKRASGAKRGAGKPGEPVTLAKGRLQGLKPVASFVPLAARLKSCPDTSCHSEEVFPQPVKPNIPVAGVTARLKSSPFKEPDAPSLQRPSVARVGSHEPRSGKSSSATRAQSSRRAKP